MAEKRTVSGSLAFWGLLMVGFLPAVSLKGTTLTATVWADEAYEVYLSHSDSEAGTLFLQGTGGDEDPQTGNAELVEGAIQYLHILVKDDLEDPSALIGSFSTSDIGFVFPNLFQIISTGSEHWKASRQSWESNFDFLAEAGVNGTDPYGQKAGINADAQFLWSEGGSGTRYFTMALHPTNSTPRRFDIGYQPIYNSIEDYGTKTEGVPNSIVYEDGPSRALALAYPGRVGARTEEILGQGPGDLYTAAWASFDSPDFVLTTTGDQTSADISLNFTVNGTMIGGVGKGGLPIETSTSFSELSFYARISNGPLFYTIGRIDARYEVGTETPGTEVTTSDLYTRNLFPADVTGDAGDYIAEYNVTIDKMFTTPAKTIEVGVPFTVKLSNQIISSVTSDTGHALSKIDFTGGLSFPTSGAVFNVPEGFTVNSISGTVRDNVFEGDPLSEADPEKLLVPGLFMQIPDIPGESQTKGHEDWIDLTEVSSGLYRGAQGRRRSSAVLEDIEVSKIVDKSSPKLAQALLNGIIFPEVVIEDTRALPNGLWTQYEFLLSNAGVTHFDLSGFGESHQPVETVFFDYEKVDWIYRICDRDGILLQRVEAYWDLLTDTGGSSSFSNDNAPPSIDPVENQSPDPATTNTVDVTVGDMESDPEDLQITVSTSNPELIGELMVTGTGANRQISYKTSGLLSGFASISVEVFDGKDTRSTSIPVLIGTEMTPFEGFLAAHFGEAELENPKLTSPILDPDKDGILTILEFLLGTNPTEFNKSSEAMKVALDSDGGQCQLTLDFKKRLDDPNVRGSIWTSQNLKDWERMDSENPMYEESGQQGQDPLFEDTTAIITFPDVCKEPHFIRYQVLDVF